ncbi:MAG: acyltransferase [Bacteroidota bacterium]
MAFMTPAQLEKMGFKSLGKDVLISDKASIYNADQIEIGDYSRIDDFCLVSGKVRIGRNVHFAAFSNVAGGEKGIVFEDFSGLAYGCMVFTQSDDYSGKSLTNPTVPDRYKMETKAAVHIGRHVILGTYTVVFPGVQMATGSASGAQALITKSTEPWSIYFGSPARRIKARQKDLLDLEAKYLQEEEATS